MKCKAAHWVNYQGEWHKAGDVFTIFKGDAEEMKAHGELIEEPGDETAEEPEEPKKEAQEETQEEPVRRTRKRKLTE